MIDTDKLEEMIDESGFKKSFIAEKMGISRFSFWKKCNNISEFKASEISKLCGILHITDLSEKEEIFFLPNEWF